MRAVVVATMLVVVVLGCHCRKCHGQEVTSATTTPVSATDVVEWKTSVYDGLNRLTRDPYNAVCNIFLGQAFGLTTIPSGTATIEMDQRQYQRMMAVKSAINVALGMAIVNQSIILEDNRKAIDAAIESATETIRDESARRRFILKAIALRRDK